MQIFENPKELEGTFSTLSNRFALKTHAGLFDGSCKRMVAVDAYSALLTDTYTSPLRARHGAARQNANVGQRS